MFIPKAGKDEWGADTLERELRGPACLYDQWYDALGQGAQYQDNGVTYYVQTITPIRDKIFPGATIIFKGLRNGFPKQLVSGGQVDLSGTITCSAPQQASRTVKYSSWRTVYRYILNKVPTGPANGTIDVNIDPSKQIYQSEITLASGVIIYGNAPPDLVAALTPVGFYDLSTLDSYQPIVGSPYYECQDTVTRYLPIA